MAGYSGTPLGRKLGFKEDMRVVLINPPRGYDELVAPVPMGVRFSSRLTEKRRLSEALRAAVPRLKQDGMIWVSWPKKSAKVTTDITEDTIREVAFPLGLVDIKVCAVDEVWSGLKLVIRKALRE
jgi:hypothetical protein